MPFSQDVYKKNKSLMSPECVCEVLAQNTPQIFLYRMFNLSLFEGLAKTHCCVPGPLNAHELLLPPQWAELQELVCVCVSSCDFLTQTHAKTTENVLPLKLKRSQSKMERLRRSDNM